MTHPRILPRLLAPTLAVVLLSAACAGRAGWERTVTHSEEQDVRELALRYLLSDRVTWMSDRNPRYVCVGVGRRVESALRDRARGTDWDPTGGFIMRFEDSPIAVVPLSECDWSADMEVIHAETGEQALAVGLPQIEWVTSQSANLRVLAWENGFVQRSYACYLRRFRHGWTVDRCIYGQGLR